MKTNTPSPPTLQAEWLHSPSAFLLNHSHQNQQAAKVETDPVNRALLQMHSAAFRLAAETLREVTEEDLLTFPAASRALEREAARQQALAVNELNVIGYGYRHEAAALRFAVATIAANEPRDFKRFLP